LTDAQFFNWQTGGGCDDLFRLIEVLERENIAWCAIDGLAVNHWAQDVHVTDEINLAVAHDRIEELPDIFTAAGFRTERDGRQFRLGGTSRLSIRINTENGYRQLPARSILISMQGAPMRVASLEDTLAAKIAVWSRVERRPIERQRDVLDIMRLLDAHPELSDAPPAELRSLIASS
jgi:hypothetical protein